jgi:hypothetical protein
MAEQEADYREKKAEESRNEKWRVDLSSQYYFSYKVGAAR